MAGHRRAPSASFKSKPRLSPVPLRDIIILRLLNALYLATFFQPDEFFQALEPAWRLAFGPDSGAWLTWVSIYIYTYIHVPSEYLSHNSSIGTIVKWKNKISSN
jgi:hypothetical protein